MVINVEKIVSNLLSP